MEALIPLLAIFSIFFIPITGAMVILTTKFAFRPLVETLSKALRESGHGGGDESQWQIQELTEQVQTLAAEVKELKDAHDFDQKLLGSTPPTP